MLASRTQRTLSVKQNQTQTNVIKRTQIPMPQNHEQNKHNPPFQLCRIKKPGLEKSSKLYLKTRTQHKNPNLKGYKESQSKKKSSKLYLKTRTQHKNPNLKGYKESQSKTLGKDHGSIHSSTTPDPGYKWESNKLTVRHHKREPRVQPFPSR